MDVNVQAERMNVEIPSFILFFVEEAAEAGDRWSDPIIIRQALRLRLMHMLYGYIFGYITEDVLRKENNEFRRYDLKCWEKGEYAPLTLLTELAWYKFMKLTFPFEGKHISLRPSRLLPQL